ncbi:MFS transporter [Bombilactobacillus folatiphilus]|uniref:MFS transporter n=1 Tax=Bombilactobacillus folatiphilus TaxID=2923362 RepID=A0ABY4P941_9LACO|nr:MFS transporter [Bombilactobacillus folatiphilus]UQS82263.1 MFS transporter [Bombilactobacillus folatiphilus]
MKKRTLWSLSVGIILIAANLRLPITMLPPILPWLHHALGLATSLSGLLTTIPLLMFAILSPLIAKWGIRFGNARVLLVTLVVLTIGGYLRAWPSSFVLIAGTILVGIGISGGNVLLPAVIQEYFPQKATLLTSLYTFTMGLVASFGTGFAAPLVKKTSLSAAIMIMSSVSLVALIVWWFVDHQLPAHQKLQHHQTPVIAIKQYPLTWLMTCFFGLQSLLYYSMLTWLPVFWRDNHFSTNQAGLLATVFQLCGMPMSLLIPPLASTKLGKYVSVVIVGGGYALGTFGLLVVPHTMGWNLLLAVITGLASGSAFSLCMVFFQDKTSSFAQTAKLSGTAQSVGYLLAAIGPTLSGVIESQQHSFVGIFSGYCVLGVILLMSGILITRHGALPDSK